MQQPTSPLIAKKADPTPTWVRIADGIWKNTLAKEPWLYERPKVDGRYTFKALGTKNQKHAKEELARRVTARSQGMEPTHKKENAITGGDVIQAYKKAGFPDKMLNPRPELMRGMEADCCEMLLGFWDKKPVDKITDKTCDDYREWRITKLERTTAGKPKIWFVPGGKHYGCAYVGFVTQVSEGGCNAKGLAFDWVAGWQEKWARGQGQKIVRGIPHERMLETCATVEDARVTSLLRPGTVASVHTVAIRLDQIS